MAWQRVSAAWPASPGPRRTATTDRPCANTDRALGLFVLVMALLRVSAASFGSRRGATADRPCANTDRAFGLLVLAMAWTRVLATGVAVVGVRSPRAAATSARSVRCP